MEPFPSSPFPRPTTISERGTDCLSRKKTGGHVGDDSAAGELGKGGLGVGAALRRHLAILQDGHVLIERHLALLDGDRAEQRLHARRRVLYLQDIRRGEIAAPFVADDR